MIQKTDGTFVNSGHYLEMNNDDCCITRQHGGEWSYCLDRRTSIVVVEMHHIVHSGLILLSEILLSETAGSSGD